MGQEFKGLNKASPAGRGPGPVGITGQHSVSGDVSAVDDRVEALSAFQLGVYTPVSSSWLVGLQYDIERQTLTVDFRSGRAGGTTTTIEYPDVSPETAEDLLMSPSKGAWVNKHFKARGKPYRVVGAFSGTGF